MALADVLNLSRPRLAAAVLVGCAAVVALSVQSLRYGPKVWDSCDGVPMTAAVDAGDPFETVAEQYLEQTRNWTHADYCIDKKAAHGAERIISVFRRGKLVGGGEGFQIRIDPATMTVLGELAHP